MVRKFENAHILLWLLKDMAWYMGWKTLGTSMIIPTVAVALFIAYFQRHHISKLVHHISVVCWISANSIWMLSEFWSPEEARFPSDWTIKTPTLIFFFSGTGILIGYYSFLLWKRISKKG